MTSISLIAGGPPRDIPGFQNLMLITNTLSRLCLIIGAVLAVMGLNQLIQRNSFLEKLLDDENQDDT